MQGHKQGIFKWQDIGRAHLKQQQLMNIFFILHIIYNIYMIYMFLYVYLVVPW